MIESWNKYVLSEGLEDIGLPEDIIKRINRLFNEAPEKTKMFVDCA